MSVDVDWGHIWASESRCRYMQCLSRLALLGAGEVVCLHPVVADVVHG